MDIFLHYIWPLIVFVFTILVLVVIHEFGHFIACKAFNIKVLEFGFGIPPKAWGKKFGETLVSLNWLPFGGFVRPLGEDEDVDLSKLSDQQKKEWKARSFQTQTVGKRILVVVAGVLMNLLLAWVLFYIVIINEGFKVIVPPIEPTVAVVFLEAGFPAQKGGLEIGDKIIEINNQSVFTAFPKDASRIEDITTTLQHYGEKPLTLTLTDIEGQNRHQITLTPTKVGDNQFRIGVALAGAPVKEYKTPAEKIFSGITYSWDLTKITFQGLGKVFGYLGQRNLNKASEGVGGPIAIAVVTQNIVSQGWQATLDYLWFMGVISLTLFIFNILPIPALDGGRLFFLLWEAVTRKKVNAETEKKVHSVGMAVLLTLIIILSFKDFGMFIWPKIQQFLKI